MPWWHVEASDQPDRSFFKAVLIDWNFVRDNCTHPHMDKVPDPGARLQCSFNFACRSDKSWHFFMYYYWTQHDSRIQLACGLQTKEVAINTTQCMLQCMQIACILWNRTRFMCLWNFVVIYTLLSHVYLTYNLPVFCMKFLLMKIRCSNAVRHFVWLCTQHPNNVSSVHKPAKRQPGLKGDLGAR